MSNNLVNISGGILGLVGSSVVVQANTTQLNGVVLFGDVPNSIIGQTDNPNISEDLGEYIPLPHPRILVNPRMAVPQAINYLTLIPVLGTRLSVYLNSVDILSPSIAKGELYDFYFRIHILPNTIELGNVLDNVLKEVEVWNSYFITKTLAAATTTDLDGTVIGMPGGIPRDFLPLANTYMSVTVSGEGVPILDGYITLDYTSEQPILEVTGTRVYLMGTDIPYRDFVEVREWVTSVIKAKAGEQREVLREIPRLTTSSKYFFSTYEKYTKAKGYAKVSAHSKLGVPLWTEGVNLQQVTSGDLVITMDTAYLDIEVGTSLLLWTRESSEAVTIASLTSSVITLQRAVSVSKKNLWLFPIAIGYSKGGMKFSFNSKLAKASLSIVDVQPYIDPSWTALQHDSLPILTTPSLRKGLNSKYTRKQDTLDAKLGEIVRIDTEDYTREYNTISMIARTRQELYVLRRQLEYLQGRYQPFWLPSFIGDMVLVPPVDYMLLNSGGINVISNSWEASAPTTVRIVGDVEESFNISSVIDNGDGTTSIGFDSLATADILNITTIQFMVKVRLDSDTIQLKHSKGITRVTIPVVEVIA